MSITTRGAILLLLSGISLGIASCAAVPGPYPVHLRYPAELIPMPPLPAVSMSVGLQAFENISPEQSTLGRRQTASTTEVYVSWPKPIAEAFTEAAENFLRLKAYTLRSVSGWDYKPEDLPRVGAGLDVVVTGQIRGFSFKAEKKFARTEMVLDADVVFIIGDVKKMQVTTRPVKIRLERTEVFFDRDKLERFMNETLSDLLQTGLGQLR
jgi:hypothetical protein